MGSNNMQIFKSLRTEQDLHLVWSTVSRYNLALSLGRSIEALKIWYRIASQPGDANCWYRVCQPLSIPLSYPNEIHKEWFFIINGQERDKEIWLTYEARQEAIQVGLHKAKYFCSSVVVSVSISHHSGPQFKSLYGHDVCATHGQENWEGC